MENSKALNKFKPTPMLCIIQLKLQKMIVASVSLCLLVTGCTNRQVDQELLHSLDQTLTRSKEDLRHQMDLRLAALQENMSIPCSGEKARLWLPKAVHAQSLTIELVAYFTRQKETDIASADIDRSADSAFYQVRTYRDQLLALDEQITHEFAPNFEGLDNADSKQSVLSGHLQLLRQARPAQLPVIFSQLSYTIMQLGHSVVAFCKEHVGCFIEDFERFAAIVGQNTQGVLPGGTLEIVAGMGAFSNRMQPKILIDGKVCAVQADGVARDTIRVGWRSGKYSVPVRIEYINEDGLESWIDEKVKFEVLKRE